MNSTVKSYNVLAMNIPLKEVTQIEPGKYYIMKHGEGIEQLVVIGEDNMYISRGIYDPMVGVPIYIDMDYPVGLASTVNAQTAVEPAPIPADAKFYVLAEGSTGGRRRKTRHAKKRRHTKKRRALTRK
jgi:hypothetical protein